MKHEPNQIDIEAIRKTGLFDADWYLNAHPDVKALGMDPLKHYVWLGIKLGRSPSEGVTYQQFIKSHPSLATDVNLGKINTELCSTETRHNQARSVGLAILQLTPRQPRNPFYTIINNELSKRGVEIHYTVDRAEALRLVKSAGNIVVHFHQLEPLYHPGERTKEAIELRADELLNFLRDLKTAGAALVWTKHNPVPHDRSFLQIDSTVEYEALRLADRIVLLSRGASAELSDFASKLVYAPHPEFEGFYGKPVAKNEARARLLLPKDAFIFACIGELKPYKRHLMQIEAFERFCKLYDGTGQPFLLIAGNPGPPDYVRSLSERAGDRVKVIARDIPNNEMRYWMSAVDISLFAFERIWVSGSVILSISYGVPVIVPELGYLDEYISHENNGFFYRANDVSDMSLAMLQAMETPYRTHLEYMCNALKEKCSLSAASNCYLDAFKSALENKSHD